jgi:hypothetical protein
MGGVTGGPFRRYANWGFGAQPFAVPIDPLALLGEHNWVARSAGRSRCSSITSVVVGNTVGIVVSFAEHSVQEVCQSGLS